jgi:hypothetical protein
MGDLGTLGSALSHEILISIIVIIVLVMNLRASLIVARIAANRCADDFYTDAALRKSMPILLRSRVSQSPSG